MRIPVILQSEASECALACLAMVASFYGHRESLREYRARFGSSQRGITLPTLRGYAEELGFKCRAVRVELEAIEQLRRPAILHWELNHFVVLHRVGRRTVRIVDPAHGAQRISMSELSERFTGVAMELSPTVALKPAKPKDRMQLKTFLPIFRGLGSSLTGILGMTLALQVFTLVMPLNMQFAIDQGVRQGDSDILLVMAIGFGFVAVLSALTEWFRTLLVQYVGNTSIFRLVAALAHHLTRLPDTWFVSRHTGDIVSRFQSTRPIGEFFLNGVFLIVVDTAMAIGALAILFAYSSKLTLAACAFLALTSLVRFCTVGSVRKLTHSTIAAQAQEQTSFIENMQRHRIIRLLGIQTSREDVWCELYVESLNSKVRLAHFVAHIDFVSAVIRGLEGVVILLMGAGQVIDGIFSLGMLVAFTSYSGILSTRIHSLINSLVEMRMLRLHQDRIADIALEEAETPVAHKGVRADIKGNIELLSVSFGYGAEEPLVLDDIDFYVHSGEFVAITGPSGVGKSTLIKILCKLLTPDNGIVKIDGTDLSSLDTLHYRSQLGVVMQDDDLFSGSILENIAAFEGGADFARVENAARLACIHEDILEMPMGFQTLVGHMGSTLSGGQRQRVMLARAVYRNPAVMLLDEGTAQLNDELQQKVFQNLASTGTTIIAVTHDDRVLACADRKIALRRPRVK